MQETFLRHNHFLTCHFFLGCIVHNIKYLGSDIISLEHVSDSALCQRLCVNYHECNFFSFSGGSCSFLSNYTSANSEEGYVSGPANCEEVPMPSPNPGNLKNSGITIFSKGLTCFRIVYINYSSLCGNVNFRLRCPCTRFKHSHNFNKFFHR